MAEYVYKKMPLTYNGMDNMIPVCLPLKPGLEPLFGLNESLSVGSNSDIPTSFIT